MRRIIILIAAFAVLAVPAVADAKKSSTRTRVTRLEKRVRALELQLADTDSTAETAMSATDLLYSCIGALAVDPFTLPGADPTLDEYPLGLSKGPADAAPTYWVAIIDGSCLEASPVASPRSFGPRVRSLRGVR
jgi:hypothetical protein